MSTTDHTPDMMTRIEFADPQGHLLEEIANPAMKRLDVAKTYRLVLHSTGRERVNWRTVNTAIIDRWSVSALEWIKKFGVGAVMTGDTARTITEDELAERLRELNITAGSASTFYPALAEAIVSHARRSREPEYEPMQIYEDANGHWFYREVVTHLANGWIGFPTAYVVPFGKPKRPLRKLVPLPGRDAIYATLADGIERESVDLLADRIVRLLEERHE